MTAITFLNLKGLKMKTQTHSKILLADTGTQARKTRERERERERQLAKTRDCHNSSLFIKSLESRNDENSAFTCNDKNTICRPANICHTEVCNANRSISKVKSNRDISAFSKPQYDNVNSVIASEQSERGNLIRIASDLKNTQLAIQGDCHESAYADSRNDGIICHTERSEVSQNISDRDISVASLPQYDKTRDCHESAYADSRNDGIICHTERSEVSQGNTNRDISAFSKPQYDNVANIPHPKPLPQGEGLLKSSTPKRVSLSLATSALLAAVSLDMLAAACSFTVDHRSGVNYRVWLNCDGNANNYDLQQEFNAFANGNKVYGRNYTWLAYYDIKGSAGNRTYNFFSNGESNSNGNERGRHFTFNGFQGSQTTFNFGTEGSRSTNTPLTVAVSNGSNIGTINFTKKDNNDTISASVNNSRVNNMNVQTMLTSISVNNGGVINTLTNTSNGSLGSVNLSGSGSIGTLNNQGNLSNVNLSGSSNIGSLSIASGKTILNLTLNNNSNINSISGAGGIQNLTLNNNSSIYKVGNTGNITNLRVNGGASINAIDTTGTIGTLNIGGSVGSIKAGTITNLTLNSVTALGNTYINGTVSNLHLYSASVSIKDKSQTWNNGQHSDGQRIGVNGTMSSNANVYDSTRVVINIGQGITADDNGQYYNISNLVKDSSGSKGGELNFGHLVSGAGTKIYQARGDNTKFTISADSTTSYGASMYRSIVLSTMRRNTTTQNILDTMTTKTFHSDKYYNNEVELRLAQYEMSRVTNRSSKFNKAKRKNEKKLDKVREKIARLTLDQSKGQDLDKGYNNYELLDQLDAIFIPYTGRKDNRFFALPYGAFSYVDFGSTQAIEATGGALFGMQRNLRSKGIIGGYVGYEFINSQTQLVSLPTSVYTHSLQAGLTYFKTFAFTAKTWEGFIRGNIRTGIDMPNFNISYNADNGNTHTISANTDVKGYKNISIPLLYNVGAEIKAGITFYYFKRNAYLSPEISLGYDMIAGTPMKFNKPYIMPTSGSEQFYPLGGDEQYNETFWHLPQVGLAARYYKMWGNQFRTNLKAGVKYNMLNKQKLGFTYGAKRNNDTGVYEGGLSDNGEVVLPLFYGNVAADFIWLLKKNHELSFGFDVLLYGNTFDKQKAKLANEWFNGVSANANFKYAYWFGGSDYVTDKDGNAVSRSIVEGKKKPKKSTKPKKKKTKKKKSKVVYIDG